MMFTWKDVLGAIATPILVFSFAYFNFFGIPSLPSMWQLAYFISKIFADYFWYVLLICALTYFELVKPIREKVFSHLGIILSLSFLIGFSISFGQWNSALVAFSTHMVAILLILFFSFGIAFVVLIFANNEISLGKKVPLVIFLLIAFSMVSRSYIVDYMDFPRVDDFKIRVWADEDKDFIYSCAQPKGSLYEGKYEKKSNPDEMLQLLSERRVFSNADTESLCKRLFPELG